MPRGLFNFFIENKIMALLAPPNLPEPQPFAPGPTPPGLPVDELSLILIFAAIIFAFVVFKNKTKKTPA